MKKRIFLDLDGVLVNFVKGAIQKHNLHSLLYRECEWDFWKKAGLDDATFWQAMDRDFWANLEWMPDGPRILEVVEDTFQGNVALFSSPCMTDGCLDGKRDWVTNNMPKKWQRRLCFLNDKHHVASPNAMLIDDSDHNVQTWRLAGGFSYLVPRPWNQDKAHASDDGALTSVAFERFVRGLHEFAAMEIEYRYRHQKG